MRKISFSKLDALQHNEREKQLVMREIKLLSALTCTRCMYNSYYCTYVYSVIIIVKL